MIDVVPDSPNVVFAVGFSGAILTFTLILSVSQNPLALERGLGEGTKPLLTEAENLPNPYSSLFTFQTKQTPTSHFTE